MDNKEENIKRLLELLPPTTKTGCLEKFFDTYESSVDKANLIAFEYDISKDYKSIEPDLFLFQRPREDIVVEDDTTKVVKNILNEFSDNDISNLEGTILEFDGPKHDICHGFFMRLSDINITNEYQQEKFINKFVKGSTISDSSAKFINKSLTKKIKRKIQWFGQFIGRNNHSLRLAILETDIHKIVDILNHYEWEGDTGNLLSLFDSQDFKSKFHHDMFQIELEDGINERIGIEVKPKNFTNTDDWNDLFNLLLKNGFISSKHYSNLKKMEDKRLLVVVKLCFNYDGFINTKVYFGGRLK